MKEGRETDGERNQKRQREGQTHRPAEGQRCERQKGYRPRYRLRDVERRYRAVGKRLGGTKRDRETKEQRKRDTERQTGSKPKHLLLKETGRDTETRRQRDKRPK